MSKTKIEITEILKEAKRFYQEDLPSCNDEFDELVVFIQLARRIEALNQDQPVIRKSLISEEENKDWRELEKIMEAKLDTYPLAIENSLDEVIEVIMPVVQHEIQEAYKRGQRAREDEEGDVDTFMEFLKEHNLVRDVHFYRGDGSREIIIKLN